jgi:hypothetical protein
MSSSIIEGVRRHIQSGGKDSDTAEWLRIVQLVLYEGIVSDEEQALLSELQVELKLLSCAKPLLHPLGLSANSGFGKVR